MGVLRFGALKKTWGFRGVSGSGAERVSDGLHHVSGGPSVRRLSQLLAPPGLGFRV